MEKQLRPDSKTLFKLQVSKTLGFDKLQVSSNVRFRQTSGFVKLQVWSNFRFRQNLAALPTGCVEDWFKSSLDVTRGFLLNCRFPRTKTRGSGVPVACLTHCSSNY